MEQCVTGLSFSVLLKYDTSELLLTNINTYISKDKHACRAQAVLSKCCEVFFWFVLPACLFSIFWDISNLKSKLVFEIKKILLIMLIVSWTRFYFSLSFSAQHKFEVFFWLSHQCPLPSILELYLAWVILKLAFGNYETSTGMKYLFGISNQGIYYWY